MLQTQSSDVKQHFILLIYSLPTHSCLLQGIKEVWWGRWRTDINSISDELPSEHKRCPSRLSFCHSDTLSVMPCQRDHRIEWIVLQRAENSCILRGETDLIGFNEVLAWIHQSHVPQVFAFFHTCITKYFRSSHLKIRMKWHSYRSSCSFHNLTYFSKKTNVSFNFGFPNENVERETLMWICHQLWRGVYIYVYVYFKLYFEYLYNVIDFQRCI